MFFRPLILVAVLLLARPGIVIPHDNHYEAGSNPDCEDHSNHLFNVLGKGASPRVMLTKNEKSKSSKWTKLPKTLKMPKSEKAEKTKKEKKANKANKAKKASKKASLTPSSIPMEDWAGWDDETGIMGDLAANFLYSSLSLRTDDFVQLDSFTITNQIVLSCDHEPSIGEDIGICSTPYFCYYMEEYACDTFKGNFTADGSCAGVGYSRYLEFFSKNSVFLQSCIRESPIFSDTIMPDCYSPGDIVTNGQSTICIPPQEPEHADEGKNLTIPLSPTLSLACADLGFTIPVEIPDEGGIITAVCMNLKMDSAIFVETCSTPPPNLDGCFFFDDTVQVDEDFLECQTVTNLQSLFSFIVSTTGALLGIDDDTSTLGTIISIGADFLDLFFGTGFGNNNEDAYKENADWVMQYVGEEISNVFNGYFRGRWNVMKEFRFDLQEQWKDCDSAENCTQVDGGNLDKFLGKCVDFRGILDSMLDTLTMNGFYIAAFTSLAGQACITHAIESNLHGDKYKGYSPLSGAVVVRRIDSWIALAKKSTDRSLEWRLKDVKLETDERCCCNGLFFKNFHRIWLKDYECSSVGGPPAIHGNIVIEQERCGKFSEDEKNHIEEFAVEYKNMLTDGVKSEIPLPEVHIPIWRLQKPDNLIAYAVSGTKRVCIRLATSLMRGFRRVQFSHTLNDVTTSDPYKGYNQLKTVYETSESSCGAFNNQGDRLWPYLTRITVRRANKKIEAIEFMTKNKDSVQVVSGIGDMQRDRNEIPPTGQYLNMMTGDGTNYVTLELDHNTVCRPLLTGIGAHLIDSEEHMVFRVSIICGIDRIPDVLTYFYDTATGNMGRNRLVPISPDNPRGKFSPEESGWNLEMLEWYSPPAVTLTPNYAPHIVGFRGWVDKWNNIAKYIPVWAYGQEEGVQEEGVVGV